MPSKAGFLIEDYKKWFREIINQDSDQTDLMADLINGVVISSVVPDDTPMLLRACREFFPHAEILELKPTETKIKLSCDEPSDVGADRVATMLGAQSLFPKQNLLIFDCGTATTAGFLTAEGEFIGGLIAAGLKTSLEGLTLKASQLSNLEISLIRPVNLQAEILGKNTIDNIQAGIYYSALGLMKEVIFRLAQDSVFKNNLRVIGTGGFSGFFKEEGVFDHWEPDLLLWGLVAFWEELHDKN
jgi:type III pantothenate kinase